MAAHSLHHYQTPMGAYLRRMKAKLGAAATTSTAHKIAIIFYNNLIEHSNYKLWETVHQKDHY